MPVPARAIERFLERESPPPLPVRDAPATELWSCLEGISQRDLVTQPRQIQLEGLVFALGNRRCMLHYAMRTGKTWIALNWCYFLRREGTIQRPALVIAHSPLALGIWKYQAELHSHLSLSLVQSGPGAEDQILSPVEVDALVVSWPTLQSIFSERKQNRRKREENRFYPKADLIRQAAALFDAVVIDEVHMTQHHDSLRFQIAALLVENCDWRLGLTGTPFGRDPFGLWAQYYLIDGGERLTKNFYFFQQAFGRQVRNRFSPRGFDYVFDNRKMPILQKKIQDITLSRSLSDVHDVRVLSGVVELEMSAEQTRAYQDVIEGIRNSSSGQSTEVRNSFVLLRQISSGFRPSNEEDEKYVDFLEAAKFDWVEEFLDDLDPQIKCVFFHEFVHTGERLGYILERKKIRYVRLWGGSRDREAYRRHFQEGDSQILIANHATGGVGADFSAADYMCFFESPPSVIARRQAEARPLGRGERPLVTDDLICSRVEKRILELHREGADIAALFSGSGRDVAGRLS